jgi:molybdopterin-guanine dinucleotide biosynthesis protein A
MGRDKARLRLGRGTLLSRVRATAQKLGVSVRVIRRDLVRRCGPLGGIYTGLKTSRGDAEIFLACDMPFVSASLLEDLLRAYRAKGRATFAGRNHRAGFPCLLPVEALPVVAAQIAGRTFSLQALAKALGARFVRARERAELFNVNTPADLRVAQACLSPRAQRGHGPARNIARSAARLLSRL